MSLAPTQVARSLRYLSKQLPSSYAAQLGGLFTVAPHWVVRSPRELVDRVAAGGAAVEQLFASMEGQGAEQGQGGAGVGAAEEWRSRRSALAALAGPSRNKLASKLELLQRQ